MTELRELLWDHPEIADLDPGTRRLRLRQLVIEKGIPDPARAISELVAEVDGFGPLDPLMHDDDITDVMVNGPQEVWVERAGHLQRTEVRFRDVDQIRDLIDRLTGSTGTRVDSARPIADAKLPDGSRLHVVLPPLSPGGPVLSIRRFPRERPSLDELRGRGMVDYGQASALRDAVHDRQSIVVAGGTGAGKTTLLNALLGEVGDERVVTVEEVAELRSSSKHVVSLLARAPNLVGAGAIDLDDLLRAALRMRPDRVVVGEVRGSEAMTALEAASIGHPGSMVTIHASSARRVRERFVSLALRHPAAPEESTLRSRFARSFELVVFVERIDGMRRVTAIDRTS